MTRLGWPDKILNGEVICVKRGVERVLRAERVTHDWLFENTGRYPMIHYFDATGRFHKFASYKEFEQAVGRADDHRQSERSEVQRRKLRKLAARKVWQRPGFRRRQVWSPARRAKLGRAIRKIFKDQGLKVKPTIQKAEVK